MNVPQITQEMDTVMSRGLSFGQSLGEAIDKAVSQAATKIPPSSVPALAIILFSSEYSEQGYALFLVCFFGCLKSSDCLTERISDTEGFFRCCSDPLHFTAGNHGATASR
jgi:hypothetical protein